MRLRTPALMGVVGLVALTGCSGDEPASDTAPTVDTVLTPTADASAGDDAAVETESGDGPTLPLPTDLPSGFPTELPTDLGFDESCADVEAAITDGITAMQEVMTDPASAKDILGQISDALRDAAADSEDDVAAAAEELASVYDEIGAAMAGGDLPDMSRLQSAATALTEACTA